MEKAHEICLEMLTQRGCEIIDHSPEQIIAMNEEGSQIIAFFSDTQKLDVTRIKEYVSLMNELGVNSSIIVYKDSVTPYAKKIVETSQEMKIQLFECGELQYNVTKHRLVPKHEKLEDDDGVTFKKKYGIKFGGMLRTDPVSRFYGYKRGDVVKITRTGGSNKPGVTKHITYRIVR